MRQREFGFPAHQSGVVLFIALIVLVAMTIAGLALVRSSGTGLLAAGNLTFKQGSVSSGDRAIQAAITWMNANKGSLLANAPASGYYASAMVVDEDDNFIADEAAWPQWNTAGQYMALPEDAAGNSMRVVIHRMCEGPGAVAGTNCTTMRSNRGCGGKGTGTSLGSSSPKCAAAPFYRVTARVTGPKGTVSFVQAMVN